MSEPTRWTRIRELFERHRRRLATAALILFLAAVGMEVGEAYPRSVDIAVPLGGQHEDVTEARIEYTQDGESVRTVTRRYEEGAPREVRDTVELSAGDYDVSVYLVHRDGGVRSLAGHLTAPSEGVVRLALEES